MRQIIQETDTEHSVILYIENVFSKEDLSLLENWLVQNSAFMNQPTMNRKQIWYQRDKAYFCKDWIKRFTRWESKEYDKLLDYFEQKIQTFVNDICLELTYPCVQIPTINSCLVNKYSDENDFISPHQDTPLSFGKYPTIIGLSVGDSRTLKLKRIVNSKTKPTNNHIMIELNHGSIFILAGSTNHYFTHEIEKTKERKQTRYSLTFREYIS